MYKILLLKNLVLKSIEKTKFYFNVTTNYKSLNKISYYS